MTKNASSLSPATGTEASHRKVRVCSDPASLGQAAADEFLLRGERDIAARGRFTVALSGGSTPRELFRALVREAPREFPWAAVHVFWGDERTVPPNHADSNYKTAREELLEHVALPPDNIHRMRGEEASPGHAAAVYEEELRRFFDLPGDALPRFDLVYLGLGSDGHTASLFPGTRALGETERLVVANPVDKLDTTRLTLTLPVLNNAACVAFLVSGERKAAVLQRVLEGPASPASLPAQAVRPSHGELLWLVDRAAAQLLTAAQAGEST